MFQQIALLLSPVPSAARSACGAHGTNTSEHEKCASEHKNRRRRERARGAKRVTRKIHERSDSKTHCVSPHIVSTLTFLYDQYAIASCGSARPIAPSPSAQPAAEAESGRPFSRLFVRPFELSPNPLFRCNSMAPWPLRRLS